MGESRKADTLGGMMHQTILVPDDGRAAAGMLSGLLLSGALWLILIGGLIALIG